MWSAGQVTIVKNMSKNLLTREESVELTGWYIEKLLPRFKKFVKHEAESGYWLPKQFESNPVAWVEALKVIEDSMEEYINTKTKEDERNNTGSIGGDNVGEQVV